MAILLREIIQKNPPLTNLNLKGYSYGKDSNESAGVIILEALNNS